MLDRKPCRATLVVAMADREDNSTLLADLGWTTKRARELEDLDPEARPARIVNLSRGRYLALSESGYRSGPLPRSADPSSSWIAVGDWVALTAQGRIAGVLSRSTYLARRAPGAVEVEQLLAANIDYAFVVQGLDGDFNPRRMERTLAMIRSGGAVPVILLTKEDLATDLATQVDTTRAIAAGTLLFTLCVPEGRGVERVATLIEPGITAVFVGSSGAGKSTLINALLGGSIQKTRAVRADDARGRHTTTSRMMFHVPGGGFIIDSPGMREIQLWDAGEGLADSFPEIAELAHGCRFRDCRHQGEPGCAVAQACATGQLDPARLESYLKLTREVESQAARERRRGRDSPENKAIHRAIRDVGKRKRLSGLD